MLACSPRRSQGCVLVLQGLSGTGKGTTVGKLANMLPKAVTWSNGNVFRSLTPPAICAIMPLIPAAGAGAGTRSDDSFAERNLTPLAICAIRSPLLAPPDAAGALSSAFTLRSEPSFLKLRMPASSALLPSSAGGGVVDAAVGSGGGTGGGGGGAAALVQNARSSGSCAIGVQLAVEPSTANA